MKSGLKRFWIRHQVIKRRPRSRLLPAAVTERDCGTLGRVCGWERAPGAVGPAVSSRSQWATVPASKCHTRAAALEKLRLWVFPSKWDRLLFTELNPTVSGASRVSLEVFGTPFPSVQTIPTNPHPNARALGFLRLVSVPTLPLPVTASGARHTVTARPWGLISIVLPGVAKPCTEGPHISLTSENVSLFRTGWTPHRPTPLSENSLTPGCIS